MLNQSGPATFLGCRAHVQVGAKAQQIDRPLRSLRRNPWRLTRLSKNPWTRSTARRLDQLHPVVRHFLVPPVMSASCAVLALPCCPALPLMELGLWPTVTRDARRGAGALHALCSPHRPPIRGSYLVPHSSHFVSKHEGINLRSICVFSLAIILIGCASHTGVIPMGKDTFMIAKQQATGFPGLGNMKAEIIGEGSRHCASIGKEFQVVSINETQPPYILGNYPRSEITFMCLSSGDPELQRPKLQKTPDTVIEVRKP